MSSRPAFRSDVAAALLVGVLGLGILWIGSGYSFGSVRRIGPGFLPVVVGTLLVVMSIGLVFEALRSQPIVADLLYRPFVMIMLSMFVFALLMERAGLIPATCALVALSALAERPVRPLRIVVSALVLSIMGVVVFIQGLGMPLRAVNW